MATPRRKVAPASAKAEAPSSPSPEEAAPSAAPAPESQTPEPGPRMETYEAVTPDGTVLVVVRNVDTGEATYTPKE